MNPSDWCLNIMATAANDTIAAYTDEEYRRITEANRLHLLELGALAREIDEDADRLNMGVLEC